MSLELTSCSICKSIATYMYIQTPYWAFVLGTAIELVGERPFLVGRLVNWLLSSGCVCMLYLLARQGGASRGLAVGAAALFTSSSVMTFSFGTARNDMLPLLFTLLACYFYLRASASTQRTATAMFFATGVVLAGAVGTQDQLRVCAGYIRRLFARAPVA